MWLNLEFGCNSVTVVTDLAWRFSHYFPHCFYQKPYSVCQLWGPGLMWGWERTKDPRLPCYSPTVPWCLGKFLLIIVIPLDPARLMIGVFCTRKIHLEKHYGRPGASQSKGMRVPGGSEAQVGRRQASPLSLCLVQVTPDTFSLLPYLLLSPLPASQRQHQDWLGTWIVGLVESPPRLPQILSTLNSLRWSPAAFQPSLSFDQEWEDWVTHKPPLLPGTLSCDSKWTLEFWAKGRVLPSPSGSG